MKTLILIALLSKMELKELGLLIKQRKRASLEALWKYLNGNKDHTDKPQFFKSVFGEPFEVSKDYLLRNELRLLNNIIEDFIAQKEALAALASSTIQRDVYILDRMLKAGKLLGFEKQWADVERAANVSLAFDYIAQLYNLKAEYLLRYKEISPKNYAEVAQLQGMQTHALQNHDHEKQSTIKLRQKYAQRVLMAIDQAEYDKLAAETPQTDIVDGIALIASYNARVADTYFLSGEDKIGSLKSLIEMHPSVEALRPTMKKDLAMLYGNIGLEYFLLSRFDEADAYYEKAVTYQEKNAVNLELLFNYCINALMLGKYDTFVRLYKANQDSIKENEKVRYRFQYFAAIAALFHGQPGEAFKLLDQNISQRPVTEYYYYRLVYAMVYYQGGDIPNSNRELENILQSFRFRSTAQAHDKPLVKLMQKLVATEALSIDKTLYQEGLQKAKESLTQTSANHSRFSTVIYKWLEWQIDTKLSPP